jgi:hypothetical protein
MSAGTTRRTFRAGAIWDEALVWAKRRGETVPEVLRVALEEYVAGAERDAAVYDLESARQQRKAKGVK